MKGKEHTVRLDVDKTAASPDDPEGNLFGLAHRSPLVAKHNAEAEGG
ncbi:MAG: hypothetical protein WCA64_02855 [Gallionella sp.]